MGIQATCGVIDGTVVDDTNNYVATHKSLTLTNDNILYDDIIMEAIYSMVTGKEYPFNQLPIIPVSLNGIIETALIDTGSTHTYVDTSLIERCSLKQLRKRVDLNTIHGRCTSFGYSCKFNWHIPRKPEINKMIKGFLLEVYALPITTGCNTYKLIIGRDVLENIAFLYDGINKKIVLKWS